MKLLVTGASGFIGRHLLQLLKSETLNVLGRTEPVFEFPLKPSYNFYKSDLTPSGEYYDSLQGVDVVVSLAGRAHLMSDTSENPLESYRYVNTHSTLNLAEQAANCGVKRFIYISSIKVNGESTTSIEPFNIDSDPNPLDHYGQSKLEAEKKLIELAKKTGMEVVIIRPPLVYGPGVKANFSALSRLVSKGIPLPFSSLTRNRRSLVSVYNLCDLILVCSVHPKAANNVFLVSDDHDISVSEMIDYMAKPLGRNGRQFPVPEWCFKFVGKVLGKSIMVDRIIGSLQVDISYTKSTLDWSPPQTLEASFEQAMNIYVNNKNEN